MIFGPGVTFSIVRGEAVKRVIDFAHSLMHEGESCGDCDPRPLLLSAVAINELLPILRYVEDREERAKLMARVAMAMNMAGAVEIEQIVSELGDALPEELRKTNKQTVH